MSPFANPVEARAYLAQIRYQQARHYYEGRDAPLGFVVQHATQGSEGLTSAEAALAAWATWDRPSSVHFAVDPNSTVCAVKSRDTAWHAKGGNSRTVGIEHCGMSEQTTAEWLDQPGIFALSAPLNAALCLVHDIPVRRATAQDLTNAYLGLPYVGGLLAHADVTESAHQRGIATAGHWDPGPAFPWDHLFAGVRSWLPSSHQQPSPILEVTTVARRLILPAHPGDDRAHPRKVHLSDNGRTLLLRNGARIMDGTTTFTSRCTLPILGVELSADPTEPDVFWVHSAKETDAKRYRAVA